MIQAGTEVLRSEIHKLMNSIGNEEALPEQWKESIILPVHRKGDKINCSNYRGMSLLCTSYKMLSNILSMLRPYIDEIIGVHQCGFRRNRSTTDQIFCIHQILGKKIGVQRDSTSSIRRLAGSL
jgi:sorting nexin-29